MNAPATPSAPSRRVPAGALLAVVLAVGAIAGLAWLQQRHSLRSAEAAAWDLNRAMALAGDQVPPEVESFYFFVVQRDGNDPAADLAAQFAQARAEKDYVGVTGADSSLNRGVLLEALAASAAAHQALDGLVVIYLGPAEQEGEVLEAARLQGVDLRFVRYAPGRDEPGI